MRGFDLWFGKAEKVGGKVRLREIFRDCSPVFFIKKTKFNPRRIVPEFKNMVKFVSPEDGIQPIGFHELAKHEVVRKFLFVEEKWS